MRRGLVVFLILGALLPALGQGSGKGPTPPLIMLIEHGAKMLTIRSFVEKHPESLFQPKVDVHGKNLGTPLAQAALAGRKDVVLFLLSAGADPNARDSADKTPIHVAVVTMDPETLRVARAHGGDVGYRAQGMFPPLLEIFAACGYEGTGQDRSMEGNLRFLLPLAEPTDEDIQTMIRLVRSIQGFASSETLASRRRKLRIVQEYLRRAGKPHAELEIFTASMEHSGKKD